MRSGLGSKFQLKLWMLRLSRYSIVRMNDLSFENSSRTYTALNSKNVFDSTVLYHRFSPSSLYSSKTIGVCAPQGRIKTNLRVFYPSGDISHFVPKYIIQPRRDDRNHYWYRWMYKMRKMYLYRYYVPIGYRYFILLYHVRVNYVSQQLITDYP